MGTEEIPANKKDFRTAASRLKHERERHGWTQSEVAERIGTTQVNISRWEKGTTVPGPYYRQKLGVLFGKTPGELGFVMEEPERKEEISTPSISSPAPNQLSVWNIPYRRNPFFTGREEILAYLHTVLTQHKTAAALTQAQAISGLGGIGKTQIAIEYAFRYCESYDAFLWVTASSRDTLIADFMTLADVLHLPERDEQDQDIVVAAVKRWLTTHTSWLLIVDNADDLRAVSDLVPMQTQGRVLLTTRVQALGPLAQSIEVEKMGLKEGILFLLRRTKVLASEAMLDESTAKEQIQATEIVTALDGLPLALDQAGAYIEETQCGFLGYLDLYRIRSKELLQKRSISLLPPDHPEPVATTWSLSFQKVEGDSLPAANLLRLLAFLHPDAIPEEIIAIGADDFGPILGQVAANPVEINAAFGTLLRYSLIRRNGEAKLLSIHRLVQAVLKDGMSHDLQHTWAERAIRAINRVFPSVELKTWDQCRRCMPHVQVSLTYLDEYGLAFPEAAHLFNEAAKYLTEHAHYEQAELFLQKALAIRERILAPAHPDTALSLNDLGALYLTQGKYQQSEPLLLQSLSIREEALGLEHPDTATSLHNLGELYRKQGKYSLAEQFYQHSFQIRRRIFEPTHPDRAQSLKHLAKLYLSQGKYPQAEEFCQQALVIQEQRLGDEHPDIADTFGIMAKICQVQHKYTHAEELYLRALMIRESTSGSDHSHVAYIINSLAEVYQAQGKYQEAEPLIRRSLAIRKQSLGHEHPYVAYSLSNLAENYFLQEDFAQAELHFKEALAIREHVLGSDHPQTASAVHNLAKLYAVQGQYVEAESLYSKALVIREQSLGPEHPDVATSLEHYAILMRKMNREDLACELEVRAKAIRAKHSQPAS